MKMISKEFQNEIALVTEDVIQKLNNKMTENEVKQIIDCIIPEIDKIISKRIKEHFKLLAEYLINRTEK